MPCPPFRLTLAGLALVALLGGCGGGGGDSSAGSPAGVAPAASSPPPAPAPAPSPAPAPAPAPAAGPLGGQVTRLSDTQVIETLVYANQQPLDIYRDAPADARPGLRPAVLLVHGGGWAAGSRVDFHDMAAWLARDVGVVPVAVDYRLTPGFRWPAQADDVEQAMWWLREHAAALRVDPDKVVVLGGSAGGHLAAWLGTTDHRNARGTSSHANRVISLWGPWDLSAGPTELNTEARDLIAALMGPLDPKVASPQFNISARAAPTLLIHGSLDPLVPPVQATRACGALQQAGVACTLLMLPGEGHGLTLGDTHALQVLQAIAGFIDGVR